jgi:hypothetical protein
MMEDRFAQEVELLRSRYPELEVSGRWVRIPRYPTSPGWNRDVTDVATRFEEPLPGTQPYGIYVPAGLLFNGQQPQNYVEPSQTPVPFPGAWGFFSWTQEQWKPAVEITKGANYLNWVLGFRNRFLEGV